MNPHPSPSLYGRKPSLSDVAAAAGVGKSTAARALSNGHKVSRKTQQIVRQAAEALGYCPDVILSQRARAHWRKRPDYTGLPIAFIQWRRPKSRMPDAIALDLTQTARQSGFHLNFIEASDYADTRRIGEILTARGVQGVILGACLCEWNQLALDWSQFSVVACENSHFEPPFDWVLQDYAWTMRESCLRLGQRGYRRPALAILRDVATPDHWEIESVFLITHRELFPTSPLPVYYGSFESCTEFLQWIERHQPDAVICNNPFPAWWLRQSTSTPPGFISLTCDDLEATTGWGPVEPFLLKKALELLDTRLRLGQKGPSSTPVIVRIRPPWHEGHMLPHNNLTARR